MSFKEDFPNVVRGLRALRMGRTLDRERSDLAKWIIAVRGPKSQDVFAEELGVARTTVSDWERGDNAPEVKYVLQMIAMAPALPLPGQRVGAALSSEYTVRIGAMLAGLTEKQCEAITAMVSQVASSYRGAVRKSK